MGCYTSIKSSRRTFWTYWKKLEVHSWERLKFPVNLSDINKFQNHNSSISVNVFGNENLVYPLRISKHNYERESIPNLLLISDHTRQHYLWIKDICKLLSLQTSKYSHVRHMCFRCLNTFNCAKSPASHHEYCISHEDIKIELPKRDRKYLLKITIGQCESHLLYMQILNSSHHNYQHANHILRKDTPISIRNASPADFVTT